MNKKTFAVNQSEREKIETMPIELLQKYLKGDGHDDKRERIWHKDITLSQFESNLASAEATIENLKKEHSVPITTFKPWEDRLAVFADAEEIVTKGGIIIPDKSQVKPSKGIVVAVGPGKDKPMTAIVGQHIYYGKYAGTAIPASESDSREILIMRSADVFGEV